MESRLAIETFDVLILGAGIVGSACALECAQAGLRVGVVERAVPGGATTAAGMGHVVVMDDSPAQFALTCYSRSLWQALAPRLPQNVEYEQCGTLWVAADDAEMAEVESKRRAYHRCEGGTQPARGPRGRASGAERRGDLSSSCSGVLPCLRSASGRGPASG